MDFLGYACNNCGYMSNGETDWDITEENVLCKQCNNVADPYDIESGVRLV